MATSDLSHAITPGQIARCEALIRPYIRRTPVIEIDAADIGLKPGKLSLKLELFQYSGSFKARGAFANLLSRKVPTAGVVAASGGNHGAAVAYAAMRLKIPAKIFVPSVSSPAKVQRIREYGADLVVEGDGYADALAASEAWAQRTGAMPVHAFDQDETILGQGTIGLELDEQISGFDTLLASVGGGGLIAGLAAWYAGRIKIVGVEPFASPTLTRALEAGRPVDAEAGGLAADSLAPKRVGERAFQSSGTTYEKRSSFPMRRSVKLNICCGKHCGSWRSPEEPRHSRQYCPAPTDRRTGNASASSSVAAIRRR